MGLQREGWSLTRSYSEIEIAKGQRRVIFKPIHSYEEEFTGLPFFDCDKFMVAVVHGNKHRHYFKELFPKSAFDVSALRDSLSFPYGPGMETISHFIRLASTLTSAMPLYNDPLAQIIEDYTTSPWYVTGLGHAELMDPKFEPKDLLSWDLEVDYTAEPRREFLERIVLSKLKPEYPVDIYIIKGRTGEDGTTRIGIEAYPKLAKYRLGMFGIPTNVQAFSDFYGFINKGIGKYFNGKYLRVVDEQVTVDLDNIMAGNRPCWKIVSSKQSLDWSIN
jgi:hypothetical protein